MSDQPGAWDYAAPKKALDQHFLTDKNIIADLVAAAEIKPGETVVEIGPGRGAVTEQLIETGAKVTAIEFDHDLANQLSQRLSSVEALDGDALTFDWSRFQGDWKLVSNLPYSLTAPIIRLLGELTNPPQIIALIIQREMADRLASQPGEKNRGVLTIACQAAFTVEKRRLIKPGSFSPAPKVDSRLIVLRPLSENVTTKLSWPIIKAGFSRKRQKISNSLTGILGSKSEVDSKLTGLDIDPNLRAEDLSLDNWLTISQTSQ